MLDFERMLDSDLDDDDREMGIFPAIAAAIPMVTSLAGSLLSKGGGKDGKSPAPEAAQAQGILDVLTRAVGGDESKGENSIKEVVRNIVATVPSPVLKQVKAAIQELKHAEKSKAAGETRARDLIVNKVDSKFGPQIGALLAGLKAQQLQRQATFEHDRLKAKAAFRSNTTNSLNAIMQRLNAIEHRLNTSAVVRGESRISALGGRYVLER